MSASEDTKIRLENGEPGTDEGSKCLERVDGAGATGRLAGLRAALASAKDETHLSREARWAAWALLALCLALLVTTMALAACWPRSPDTGLPCSAPECLRLAAEHVQRWDPAADACAEPRRWACGGWLDDASRQPTRPTRSLLEEAKLEGLKRLRDVLSTMATPRSTDALEWRLKTLYESCMAIDFLEQDGYRPLDRIIEQLGGWHVRAGWLEHAWSWRVALETLQSRLGVATLFAVDLAWHGNETALLLRPAPLGLPHPSFYQEPSDSHVVKAYKVMLKDTALSLDATTHHAARFADDIFSFEKRLADLLLGEEDDATETRTMESLGGDTVNLPFQSMLRTMLPRISITDRTLLVVSSPRYITYLLNIATSTSSSILNDYFTWTLIREYLPYLSSNFRLIWSEFQSQITGSTEEPPRWEFCAGLVQKIAPLGTLALLRTEQEKAIYDKAFETSQHAAIQDIFESIKMKASDTIVSSTKVDGQTKALMLEQLGELKLQIGLKPHEISPEFIQRYHNGFAVQKHDLFRNIGFSLEFELELMQSAYNDKELGVVRDNARKLNQAEAFYNTHTSTVLLPSAMATVPYFHSDYPRFVQYARLGTALGAAVARALAVRLPDPHADGAVPAYAAPTVHCLLDKLRGAGAGGALAALPTASRSAPAAAAYVRVLGATLALDAARASDADTALPQLHAYHRDSLFALTYAQSMCSVHTSGQAKLDAIHSQMDGETMQDVLLDVSEPHMGSILRSAFLSRRLPCQTPSRQARTLRRDRHALLRMEPM